MVAQVDLDEGLSGEPVGRGIGTMRVASGRRLSVTDIPKGGLGSEENWWLEEAVMREGGCQ